MTIVVTLKNAVLDSADQLVSSFFFRKRKILRDPHDTWRTTC